MTGISTEIVDVVVPSVARTVMAAGSCGALAGAVPVTVPVAPTLSQSSPSTLVNDDGTAPFQSPASGCETARPVRTCGARNVSLTNPRSREEPSSAGTTAGLVARYSFWICAALIGAA